MLSIDRKMKLDVRGQTFRDAQRNSHDLCEFSLFPLVSYEKCGIIKKKFVKNVVDA